MGKFQIEARLCALVGDPLAVRLLTHLPDSCLQECHSTYWRILCVKSDYEKGAKGMWRAETHRWAVRLGAVRELPSSLDQEPPG